MLVYLGLAPADEVSLSTHANRVVLAGVVPTFHKSTHFNTVSLFTP